MGLAWLAASLALLGCVAWSYRRLDAVAGGCVASRVEGVRVLVSERAGPMVVGVVHPELVLPRWVLQAPAEERRLIVWHEREHVAGGDPWLLLLATLAVALMPWSPALWVQHRRLRLALETDCDARVLASGASRRLYGQALLRTATHPFSLPVLAPAWGERTSHLRQRIDAMTAKPPSRRLLRAFPLCVLAAALFAVACDVASKGISSAGTRTAAQVADAGDMATHDFPDGTSIVVTRNREPDPTLGYTGLTPYYAERPHVVRDGVRTMRRVESFPVVVGVDPGSPAERAGFRERDVLLAVNGRDSREPPVERLRPGTELAFRVRRDGREIQLRLVAGSSPPKAWPPSRAEFEAAHRQHQVVETLKP
jgi:BlaR1 peptidase M56/PDZ domain